MEETEGGGSKEQYKDTREEELGEEEDKETNREGRNEVQGFSAFRENKVWILILNPII
jgi:hypothetical protein